jgi:signal transduction histidine kinase
MGTISLHNAVLYDSLAKQNLKLSEIANLKTQFVSTITHELSTPLNGILGMTEVLSHPDTCGPLTDDQRRYIQMIHSAGEELSDMVNQILDLTRFQSQRETLEVKRVDLAATVQGVHLELQEALKQKGMKLHIDLGPRAAVYGDEGQIRQVFQSLLENSVKFAPSDRTQLIHIQASRHGDMLKICVMDQGIGIEEKDQEIIFDEFRQVNGELSRSYGGTGLGLALAKKIIELHGGRIWVESKKGEGSRFYFTLPLKPGLVKAPEIETQRQ